jgi:hypothetical protein
MQTAFGTGTHIADTLTSFWLGTQQYNLTTFETYYYGQQTARDGMLTTTQAAKPDINRFWQPVNYTATVIDEPVGYLANGRVRITTDDERLTAWANDYHNRRIRARHDDLVRWRGIYGDAYLYYWTDYNGHPRGLKVDCIPPVENGKRRVAADYGGQDPEELTKAVILKTLPADTTGAMDEYRITVTPTEVTVETRKITGNARGSFGTFTLVSRAPNPANVLPIVPVFNPIPSDILDFINIQNDLDKLHLDLRLSREYHGLPLLTTTGMDVPDLSVGAGQLLYGGDFKRLDPPTNDGMMAERDALLHSGALITRSLALSNQSGRALSGVAVRFLQQNFEARLLAKAQRVETGLENALSVAARLIAADTRLYELEVRDLPGTPRPTADQLRNAVFEVRLEPNVPADEKANAEIAAIWLNQLGVSRETAFGKAGIENPAAEVERAEMEREAQAAPAPVEPGMLDADDER